MKEKEPLIICDTNIWYAIGEGKIDHRALVNIRLIGTFVSAYELSHSPAIYKKTEIWKRSVDAFLHLPVRHKYYSPPSYLNFLSGKQQPNTGEIRLFSDLRALRNGIDVIDPKDLIQRIHQIKATLKQNASDGMEQIRKAQVDFHDLNQLKELLKYPKYKHEHIELTKKVLLTISGNDYIDWKKLDLWLHTYNEWLIRLTRDKNIRLTNNDFNDLMNLAYVPPGSKYWSLDEKKTLPLVRDAGCENYLFSLTQ